MIVPDSGPLCGGSSLEGDRDGGVASDLGEGAAWDSDGVGRGWSKGITPMKK